MKIKLNGHDFRFPTGDTTFSTPVTDRALCDADPRLAKHASPRQVAGGPLAENILKCRLKPLNPVDYAPVTFSSAQWARLPSPCGAQRRPADARRHAREAYGLPFF